MNDVMPQSLLAHAKTARNPGPLIEAAEANTLRDLIFPTDEPEPGDTHSIVRHPGTYR